MSASKVPVRVIVDVHERASGMPESLVALGAEVEIAALPAGDYGVGLGALVERKTVSDLHGAIIKGRLWPQLAKLRSESVVPYLLVEGRDVDRGPLHPNAVRGACLAVIDQGVALLRTADRADSARWLHRLAVRWQREHQPSDRPPYAQRPSPSASADAAEALLAAVPGISTVSARALLERFGSVSGVVGASLDELLAVPGIGRERARALVETFRWEPPGAPALPVVSKGAPFPTTSEPSA